MVWAMSSAVNGMGYVKRMVRDMASERYGIYQENGMGYIKRMVWDMPSAVSYVVCEL